MALIPTATTPSNSNLQGGLAGLVASMAVGFLSHAGYLAIAASAIGVPEATMVIVVTGVIGALANVAVTHVAELHSVDSLVKALPTTYAEYPSEGAVPGTPNNLNQGG